jgi:MFS family permease
MVVVMVDVTLARIAFGAIVPSLRSDLHIDLAVAGVVSSANAVGYLISSALAPILARSLAIRRLALVSHLLAAAGFAAVAVSPNVALLVTARVLSGLGGGTGIVSALRLALDSVEPSQRTIVSTLAWSGGGLGAILVALSEPWLNTPLSWRVASAACALLSLAIALATPSHMRTRDVAPWRNAGSNAGTWQWRQSLLILFAYLMFGAGTLSYSTYLAVTPSQTTPLVRFLLLGVFSIVGGLIATRVRHPERAMAAALALAALGAGLALHGLALGDACIGLSFAAVPGLGTAVLRERAGAAAAMHALAVSTITLCGGQFAGPILAGIAAQTAWHIVDYRYCRNRVRWCLATRPR